MLDTIFSITALVGGTVLGFQFVLVLIGLGDDGGGATGDHGLDVSGHGDLSGGVHGDVSGGADGHALGVDAADHNLTHGGMQWFYEVISLRTLSAAMAFFGISGKTALANGMARPQAFLLATLVGLGAMYAVYWLFKQAFKLQHTGNENVHNAIGAAAKVYVPIPGKRGGAGKVTFQLQGRLVEYQAITDDDQRLATGEPVVIVGIVNSDTVRVARSKVPIEA